MFIHIVPPQHIDASVHPAFVRLGEVARRAFDCWILQYRHFWLSERLTPTLDSWIAQKLDFTLRPSASTSSKQVPVPEVLQLRLLLFFNAFGVHHACQNTIRSLFYHCWLLPATPVPRQKQSAFFPEENISSRRWLFLIAIKFYHRLAGTLVPRDAFLGRAKASLRSELLAFRVLLWINLLTAEGK
jgi:hypothetical protein